MATTSAIGKIDVKDLAKGLAVTVISAVLTVIYDSFSKGSLSFDWKLIAVTGGTAGIGYLIKNLFTPAQVVTPADPK